MTNTTVQEITLANKRCGALTINELVSKTGLDPWEVARALLKMYVNGLADRDTSGRWTVVGGGMKI